MNSEGDNIAKESNFSASSNLDNHSQVQEGQISPLTSKKRGRKPSKKASEIEGDFPHHREVEDVKKPLKKRGRKPKVQNHGGEIKDEGFSGGFELEDGVLSTGIKDSVLECTEGVCENVSEKLSKNTGRVTRGMKGLNEKKKKKKKVDEGNNGGGVANTCHQCKRNDKGRTIPCNMCKKKRFCIPCITTWYPNNTEEYFAEACSVCRENCNCKACLRLEGAIKEKMKKKKKFIISDDDKKKHSLYLLQAVLPYLKQFHEEQVMEKEVEARIQGVPLSEGCTFYCVDSRHR